MGCRKFLTNRCSSVGALAEKRVFERLCGCGPKRWVHLRLCHLHITQRIESFGERIDRGALCLWVPSLPLCPQNL